MKTIQKLLLYMFVIVIQNNYCISKAQTFQNNKTLVLTADNLTMQSYISPRMQWAVLSLIDKPAFFEINRVSGAVQGISTVRDMLSIIDMQLLLSPDNAKKESIKQALNTMLEATDIAFAIITIKASHQDPVFIPLKNMLIKELNHQRLGIQRAIDKVYVAGSRDKLVSISSLWNRWFKVKKTIDITEEIMFDNALINIKIPQSFMEFIIKNNDYTQQSDITYAANLLCKQCFIAQQPYNSTVAIPLNLKNPISSIDYIFTNFPDIYDKYSRKYPLCEYVESLDQDACVQLVCIREAIQTALSIVNKKLTSNIAHFLPVLDTSYLDGIAKELMKYDAHVSKLCVQQKMDTSTVDVSSQQSSIFFKTTVAIFITAIVCNGMSASNLDDLSFPLNKLSDYKSEQPPNFTEIVRVEKESKPEEVQTAEEISQIEEELPKLQELPPPEKVMNEQELQETEDMRSTVEQQNQQAESRVATKQKPTNQCNQNHMRIEPFIDLQNNSKSNWQVEWERENKKDEVDRKTKQELDDNENRSTVFDYISNVYDYVSKMFRTHDEEMPPLEYLTDDEWIPLEQKQVREEQKARKKRRKLKRELRRMDYVDRRLIENVERIKGVDVAIDTALKLSIDRAIEIPKAIQNVNNWAEEITNRNQLQVRHNKDKQLPPVRFLNLQENQAGQNKPILIDAESQLASLSDKQVRDVLINDVDAIIASGEFKSTEALNNLAKPKQNEQAESNIVTEQKTTNQFRQNRVKMQLGIDVQKNPMKELQSYYLHLIPEGKDEDLQSNLRVESNRKNKEYEADDEEIFSLEHVTDEEMSSLEHITDDEGVSVEKEQEIVRKKRREFKKMNDVDRSLIKNITATDMALHKNIAWLQAQKEQALKHNSYSSQAMNKKQQKDLQNNKFPELPSVGFLNSQKKQTSQSESVLINTERQVAIIPGQQVRDIPIDVVDVRALNRESVQRGREDQASLLRRKAKGKQKLDAAIARLSAGVEREANSVAKDKIAFAKLKHQIEEAELQAKITTQANAASNPFDQN